MILLKRQKKGAILIMTAKEMFEKLGYKQECWCFEEEKKIDEIVYIRENRFASNVTFRIENKCFKIHRKNETKSAWCELKLLQAINKQVEELGWNKEG